MGKRNVGMRDRKKSNKSLLMQPITNMQGLCQTYIPDFLCHFFTYIFIPAVSSSLVPISLYLLCSHSSTSIDMLLIDELKMTDYQKPYTVKLNLHLYSSLEDLTAVEARLSDIDDSNNPDLESSVLRHSRTIQLKLSSPRLALYVGLQKNRRNFLLRW
jgi:hypothetical protein